ncbi:hypothetical protein BJ741DRAFT_651218 [Chytriomyces cf. hyalinus JEL632]|nr:hypothetical protein BJ741DRAFT_651218 [Chytriomyces cf. hyalinus JEL632]
MELHHTLITEIFDLRESLIAKTDRLLSLLRPTNVSPIENFNGKKSQKPRKDSPFKMEPDGKTPSLADLGCRITSQDYAASGSPRHEKIETPLKISVVVDSGSIRPDASQSKLGRGLSTLKRVSNSASCDSDPKQSGSGDSQQALSQTYSFQSESIPFDENSSTHEMKDYTTVSVVPDKNPTAFRITPHWNYWHQEHGRFSLGKRVQFCFLLPAYDNKGQRIRLEHLDIADFDSISFMEHGLHPKSDFSTVWDLVMISAYFVILWTTLFIVGFDMNHEVTHNIQIAVTIVYLMDSLVAMLTPQSDATDSTSSFREYESARPSLSTWLRSWLKFQLFFDLISIIPSAVFMETEAEKVLSFIRLVRIVRIPAMMQRCAYFRRAKLWIDDTLGVGISKTFPVALIIFFFIHLNACTMYFVAKTNDFRGWDLVWPGFLGASEFEAYTWTFFLAVGNLFPMAFKPQTAIEQILADCQICVGTVLYAAFVGLVSSAAISLNASGQLYNQKMEELIDYVKWKRLDTLTRDKLVSHYETKYRGKYFEEDALLSDMNESLREEIACHNTRGLMEKVPFLRREEMDGRDDTYVYKLATVLHARYFIPGDFMMKQGESGSDMYFILSGKVNVFVDGNRVTSLYDSSYIGEMSLITKSRRTATVQVALPSVTYRLTRQDFLTVIGEFPDMRARINAMVEEGERIARSP